MELALGLFGGLVLFAAFGRQTAALLRIFSPALVVLVAKLLRVAGIGGMIATWGFTALIVVDLMGRPEGEDGGLKAIVVGLVGIALGFFAAWLGGFASGVMSAAGSIAASPVVGDLVDAVEEQDEQRVAARRRKRRETAAQQSKLPPAAKALPTETSPKLLGPGVFDALDEDDARWTVDLDAMTLTQDNASFRLRRASEGHWEVRDAAREWSDIDDCLATVIETKWRRYVRG